MHKETTDSLRSLEGYLPRWLNDALKERRTAALEEIRIRAGRPVQLVYAGRDELIAPSPDMRMCNELTERICEHSVAVRERELARGYITLMGCRVGVCGKTVSTGEGIARYEYINGLNIRIAREVKGCARGLMPYIYDADGNVKSTLVLSAPGAGKTTLLRDAARLISDGFDCRRARKVCIADERSELAGEGGGIPVFDVGARTDVIQGCNKRDAIASLIRSMSPEVIITDELGGAGDAQAVLHASASGTAVIASVHAGSLDEAMEKTYVSSLVRSGCFGAYIRLFRRGGEFGMLEERTPRIAP